MSGPLELLRNYIVERLTPQTAARALDRTAGALGDDRRTMTRMALRDVRDEPTSQGSALWTPDYNRSIGAVSAEPSPFSRDWQSVNWLGSIVPGGGRDLMHSLRAEGPYGLYLTSLDLPNTQRFYRSMGMRPPEEWGLDPSLFNRLRNYDYVLPPDEPFRRRRGGLV